MDKINYFKDKANKSLVRLNIYLKNRKWQNLQQKLRAYPAFTEGYINLFGKKFLFHDGKCFLETYKEIFIDEIYRFNPSNDKKVILDCGANMGLSVLFFSLNYPNHEIIAFEPDDQIFSLLKKNVETFDLTNVELVKKAVWDKEDALEFYTDGGMGGRIKESYSNQIPKRVETIRLKEFLNGNIDFLKIDIEGAEEIILIDCENELAKVNKIFFEYHGFVDRPQRLHDMLAILNNSGFHYYIKESFTRRKPFLDEHLICERFDMAINIFAYKEKKW